MKLHLTIAILLVFNLWGWSQQCTHVLTGEINDLHDHSPLQGAQIWVVGTTFKATSDARGKFLIQGLCTTTYELEVSHPECSTQFKTVRVSGDRSVQITLEHHVEELEEVMVTAKVSKTNSATEYNLGQESIEKHAGGSLGDALKEITGVSSLNTGGTIVKPIINGLSGSRVLIMNQGVRMQDMEWGEEHAPNVDLNTAGNIALIKGAGALEYGGDAIGGVIITEAKQVVPKDSLFGHILLNGATNGRGGNTSGGLTKSFSNGVYAHIQGSYKYMGDTKAPDYVLSNTGVREGAFSFQLGKQGYKQGFEFYYSYFKTKIAILKSAHIGNTDDLIDAINNAEPNYIAPFTYAIGKPYQDVTHHLGKINYYRRFEGLGKWFVQYDFQRNHRLEFDTRIGDNRDRPSIDLQLDTHTWRTYLQWKTSENFALKTGVNAGYQDNFADPSTGVKRLIPDYNKYDFGFFATSEYYWKPNTTIDAAFRYDFNRIDAKKFYSKSRWDERGYQEDFGDDIIGESGSRWLVNPVLDFHNFSFSAGLSHIWEDGKSFRFNYTLAQRAPNPSELFSDGLHHSAARIELGDLRMQQETSHKLGLSFAKTHGALQYELSPFINLIDNFILLEPTATQLSLAGAFPVWTYRQTSAHLFGVDLNASYDWTDQWQSKHAFSLVKGTDTDKDIPLINIPPVRFNNGIIYQIPQWHGLRLELDSAFVFEQNETPPNIWVFSPDQQQDVELKINDAPGAYHLLGFGARATFPMGKHKITAHLRVDNLLNNSYRDYLNRLRYFADDMGRNTSLLIRYNF